MNQSAKILYLDDEPSNLKTFEYTFDDIYEIHTFTSSTDALHYLENNTDTAVIISDQKMPGMSGIEFLERTIDIIPDASRILLTAYTEREDLLEAINTGRVYSYIVKPWEESDVKKIINDAATKYFLLSENKRLIIELKHKIDELNSAQDQLIRQENQVIIGSLSAGLSHEIKNLLNPITLLSVMRKKLTDKQDQEFIDIILNSRDHIVSLIDEIRGFARNEQSEYTFSIHSLESVISEAVKLASMDPDVRGISIEQLAEKNLKVKINKNKIIQVFLNIIRNAAHAIKEKNRGLIKITASKDAEYIKISFKDNGSGIPEEILKKIWIPFYTTKGENGTGIGLDISRRIIENHGGSISCSSKENMGSEFIITLKPEE